MDPIKLLEKYFDKNSRVYKSLIRHSREVLKKSIDLAEKVKDKNPDINFIKEAAILHDIGISAVGTKLDSNQNKKPYIFHGILGRKILEKEGLPLHALVAERHVGSGINKKEALKLGLPAKDMLPKSIEEKIICFADKFSSKSPGKKDDIKSIEKEMASYGHNPHKRFLALKKLFGY